MRYCPRCHQRFADADRCPLDGDPLAPLDDPRLGALVGGRYRVLERIGAGGMATVYRARHEARRRDVALKVLAPSLVAEPLQRERFLREGRAMGRLRHRNVVAVFEVGEDGGDVFLALELLQGVALAERLVKGALPPREAVRYALQVSEALAHAHEAGVVHRDIKPENLFLAADADGAVTVKVLDFGLAFVRSEARLTSLGSVVGTPEYLSPEMARGQDSVPSSDLYALGVVLFEMLTGALPFQGTAPEVIVQHASAPPPALGEALPAALRALVASLLAKVPSGRPRDAWHLVKALTAILPGLPEEPSGEFSLRPRARGTPPELSALEAWRPHARALLARCRAPDLEARRKSLEDALGEAEALAQTLEEETLELARREAWSDEALERLSHALEALGLEQATLNGELSEGAQGLRALKARVEEHLTAFGAAPDSASAGQQALAWKALRDQERTAREALRAQRLTLEDLSAQRAALRQRLLQHEEARERELSALRLALGAHGAELEAACALLAQRLGALQELLGAPPAPDQGC
ncbi:MAG: protein kinase [Deltaproteobacteria bacterium]|nr:protein kinase [Deltaproteobacteria bacterium]